MEIDLKRLLHRLQGAMSVEAHSALGEDEALRRWALVEHAKELLSGLSLDGEDEDHQRQLYEAKLKFITDFMLASEGVRPALRTSPLPEGAAVRETKDDHDDLRTQLLIQEERFIRHDLLDEPQRTVPSEAELRRQLGLGQRTAATSTARFGKEDFNQQLEQQGRERESVTNDIIHLLGSIRDNSLNVQSSLEKDHRRLDGLASSLEANSGNLAQEMQRMGQLYLATSQSCRASCVMVLAALGIFFFSFLVLKLTPRPV